MYLLSTPELGTHVHGLALIDTAPDAGWFTHHVQMTQVNPLAVRGAFQVFAARLT